jgi:hypothetical protein
MAWQDFKRKTKKASPEVSALYRWLIILLDIYVSEGRMVQSAGGGPDRRASFITKIAICEEKDDKTSFWSAWLAESKIMRRELRADLLKESDEPDYIFISSGKTAHWNSHYLRYKTRSLQ